jgi:hypothetical protein
MDDAALGRSLDALGIGRLNFPAVAVLPLIESLWDDERVDAVGRERFGKLACDTLNLPDAAARVVQGWLRNRPNQHWLGRANAVLVELADRPGASDRASGGDIIDFCRRCAWGAGDAFGQHREPPARESLEQLAHACKVDPTSRWDDFFTDVEDTTMVSLSQLGKGVERGITTQPDEDGSPAPLGAGGDARALLQWQHGGKAHRVRINDVLNIGRGPDNEVRVHSPKVSRHHFRIEKRSDGFWAVDRGSENGTLINDMLVKERRLVDGDAIAIGDARFEFRLSR